MTEPNYPGLTVPATRLASRILTGVGILGLIYGAGIIFLVTPGEGSSSLFIAGSALFGVAGMVWAVLWRNRVLAKPTGPRRFLTGTVIAAAVAELGLLVGLTGYVTTGDLLGPAIGGVLFILSILILGSTIGSVELDTTGWLDTSG
jgi:hypothetical protein